MRIAIITPLHEELDALLEEIDQPAVRVRNNHFLQFNTVVKSHAGYPVSVDIYSQAALGRAHAAALVTYISLTSEIDLILIAGTCGALTSIEPMTGTAIEIGDVILSTSIADLELRKFSRGSAELEINTWYSEDSLLYAALALQASISSHRDDAPHDLVGHKGNARRNFKMHLGGTISSSSVIADTIKSRELFNLSYWRDGNQAIAVEMEASGALSAASIFKNQHKIAMIRGVSDFSDDLKNDNGRAIACRNAAVVSLEFVRSVRDRDLPAPKGIPPTRQWRDDLKRQ